MANRFDFGRNWLSFLAMLDEQRIQIATQSLQRLLGRESLAGLRFLDIGCGSGLFSLAARALGAQVHSFDYDEHCVDCAQQLKQRFFPDDHQWTIEQGSVLDAHYLEHLGRADIVYSWGVLHHTGHMWQAIGGILPHVAPGGLLVLSIYNDQGTKSRVWRRIKKRYVDSGPMARLAMVGLICAWTELRGAIGTLLRGEIPRPWRAWRLYKQQRGMSRWHDYVDWVGGYPFETATPEELFSFVHARGFELKALKTAGGGLACNEFMFQKKPDPL